MPSDPNKLYRFWQELKRRRVIYVIVVYATAAFAILEAVDIIFPRLSFPDWTISFVLILLVIGFPIAIIFSWIFDVTPEGIEKTKPSKKIPNEERSRTTHSWRIATYVSVVIIVGLLIVNIFGGKNKAKIDESLEKSIAILPFHNFSGNPNQDVMCDGLTDEIINHLYRIESFDKVVSLTSVLKYKGANKDIPEIADELKVNYILEGTAKKIGDQLRVSAQLIEPANDKHIWQKDYDRPYEEVITIPADIALQIANHLKTFLTNSEEQNIQKVPTSNLDAFTLLKQAQLLGSDPTSFIMDDRVIELALKAIELDPDFANANASMGFITLMKANYGGKEEMQSAGWEALPYLEKALEIDPDNWLAHFTLGTLNDWFKWDYVNAEREYLKALELMPNNSSIRGGYGGQFLVKMSRLEDARKHTLHLLSASEDPLFFTYQFSEIRRLIIAGARNEALTSINTLLELWKKQAYVWAGDAFLWLEEYDSALYYLEAGKLAGEPEMSIPRFQAYLALAYRKTNHHTQARKIINQLIARSDTTSAMSPAFFLGCYYSGIEELDSAFYWLEKAVDNRSPEIPWLKTNPILSNLKDDDRYWDLYVRTGHKAYDDYMDRKNSF